jgi:hypothetical protein
MQEWCWLATGRGERYIYGALPTGTIELAGELPNAHETRRTAGPLPRSRALVDQQKTQPFD